MSTQTDPVETEGQGFRRRMGLNPEKDTMIRVQATGPTPLDWNVIDSTTGKRIRGVTRINIGEVTCDRLATVQLDVELWDGIDIEAEASAIRVIDMRDRLRALGSGDQRRADEDARSAIIDAAFREIWSFMESRQCVQRGSPNGLVDIPREETLREELAHFAERIVVHDRTSRGAPSQS